MKRYWQVACIVAVLAGGLLLTASAQDKAAGAGASDWPIWRGPHHDGISAETLWKSQWPAEGPKVLWKADIGVGYSAAATIAGKVYCAGNKENVDTVYCFDAKTGQKVWTRSYPCPTIPEGKWPGTRSSPVIDGGLLFIISRQGQMLCLNAATGEVVWQKDLRVELQAKEPTWGFAGSALVQGDRVIVDVGTVAAMDKKTGNVIWKSEKFLASYSTPVPLEYAGQKLLACFNGLGLVLLTAEEGKTFSIKKWKTNYDINAADPVLVGEKMIFITSGYKVGGAMLEIAPGEMKEAWKTKDMGAQFSAPVLYKGCLYGFDGNVDNSILKCLDAATGAVKWVGPKYKMGSLMLADGKLITQADGGELAVVQAAPDGYHELAKAKPLDGQCWTMPVLSDGVIYCRSNKEGQLVAVDVSAK